MYLYRLTPCPRKYSIYDATVDDWSAILKLAFDWRFSEVKKFCVRELEKFEIAPLHKIELYQAYELDKKLLIPSYVAMCMRPEPLSIKEGRQLGLETALLLATAREGARGRPSSSPGQLCSSPVTVESDDMISIIKDVFGIIVSPPSPSLSPLENTGTASASMTPATNVTNGTTKLTTPKKAQSGTTPSINTATTAVNSVFGTASTPTVTAAKEAAAKDTVKSPGQSTSTSSPTILSGRLNSVFAPMQGTVRPPPLEPPPRAPSPQVETPMVEEASSADLPAPLPAQTPAVQTSVLETPPVKKVEEQPAKPPPKQTKKGKKAAQKKAAAQLQAAESGGTTTPTKEEEVPNDHSTSTPDVISSQSHSQSDAPILVDITSVPTTAPPQQSQTAAESTTPDVKSKEDVPDAGETPSDSSHEPSGSCGSGQDQHAENGRKEGGVAQSETPAVPVSDPALAISTSAPADVDATAATTAQPTTEGPILASDTGTHESVPTTDSAEGTTPAGSTGTTSGEAPAVPSGSSDPILEGGDKTQSSGKDNKTESEANADVKVDQAAPVAADAPAAPETSVPSVNGDASTTTATAADATPVGDKTVCTSESPNPDAAKTLSAPTTSAVHPATPSTANPPSSATAAPLASSATAVAADTINLSPAPTSGPERAASATAEPTASAAPELPTSSTADPSTPTPKADEGKTGATRSGTPKPGSKGKKTPGNTPGQPTVLQFS